MCVCVTSNHLQLQCVVMGLNIITPAVTPLLAMLLIGFYIVIYRCLSIPVTIHAGFSRAGVLPSSIAAALRDHQEALRAFGDELTSCDIAPVEVSSHMANASEHQSTGVAAGTKRKRPAV